MQKIRPIQIGKDYAIKGEQVKAVVILQLGSKFNNLQQITFEGAESVTLPINGLTDQFIGLMNNETKRTT